MTRHSKIKIAVLPGDGIGEEVTLAALPVIRALNIPAEMEFGEIGWKCWQAEGTPVPAKTWTLIRSAQAVLLGAVTSQPEREAKQALPKHLQTLDYRYVSPVVQLRQELDLYANVRPCVDLKGRVDSFRFCLIRENTEGLYAGLDFYPTPPALKAVMDQKSYWKKFQAQEVSCTLRLQSRAGLVRLFNFAFHYAATQGFERVTWADKPNVLRQSAVLSREIFEAVASQYPKLKADIANVDAVALWMVKRPEQFGVIVAENMFGDILSDLGAGLMGGLGFAPSANVGDERSYFEPVHGSAPNMAPRTANPSAMFLTIALMLRHLGYEGEADQIERAVRAVIREQRYLTYDLGGSASTEEMANAILERVVHPKAIKSVSFLATGNEVVEGDVHEANGHRFSHLIAKEGGQIHQHLHVSDNPIHLEKGLRYLLDESDAVVVTGGLGPTSDDNTRYAVSRVGQQALYFDDLAWQHVSLRLTRFKLPITESNRQQALFPKGAVLFPNDNGTAFGCHFRLKDKHLFMLPGPPRECWPMFEKLVLPILKEQGFLAQKETHRWLTLGLIEGEIAPEIDQIISGFSCQSGYRLAYPYLEIKVIQEKNALDVAVLDEVNERLKAHTVSRQGEDARQCLVNQLKVRNNPVTVWGASPIEAQVMALGLAEVRFMGEVWNPLQAGAVSAVLRAQVFSNTVNLEFQGYWQDKLQCQHALSIPNRGAEVTQYIQHYLAWQLGILLGQMVAEVL